MADIADHRHVFHAAHMFFGEHVTASGRGDEQVADAAGLVHGHDFVALHGGLQSTDRIDLGHDHPCALATQRLAATLTDIAVAGHDRHFTGQHQVGRPADAIHQRVAAAIQVIELRFRDGIIHIEGREEQTALFVHLVESVYTGGGLFRYADNLADDAMKTPRIALNGLGNLFKHDGFFGTAGGSLEDRGIILGLDTEVHKEGRIATVIEDHVRAAPVAPVEDAVGILPVLFEGLAFPGEDRRAAGRDGGRRVVLRRIDVAAGPAHLGAERLEGLDQDSRLDRHVERSRNARPLERLGGAVVLTQPHQAGHLMLGQGDLTPSKIRQ